MNFQFSPPALAIIARELNLRLIDTMCCSTYDGMERGKVEMLKGSMAEADKGKGWLIIDDLVDTGVTAKVKLLRFRGVCRLTVETPRLCVR